MPFSKVAGGPDGIQRVLELARRHLGMDVAFLAEFVDGNQVYRRLDGDAASFGWGRSQGIPLSETYCQLMTAGEIPNAITDAKADERVRDLPSTRASRIGSYIGVPIRLPDGTLYGSLCCLSHEAWDLHERDVKFLSMLGEIVEGEVEAQQERDRARADVADVIDHRRVDIALQPIFDIATGRVLGVEALSRFPRPMGSPDVVFAQAYEVGLGIELERVAVGTAFELLSLLDDDQYLALNLTPAAACELSQRAAAVPDLPYNRLVLEITEHAAVDNYGVLRDCLAPARDQGLRLAIDDAGAGFASLQHIVEMQPDIIKVDRSLIDGMSRVRALRSAAKAFVALADDLGATVVAEGVERAADLATARDLGVKAAQGYLLGRPSTDRADLAKWSRRA